MQSPLIRAGLFLSIYLVVAASAAPCLADPSKVKTLATDLQEIDRSPASGVAITPSGEVWVSKTSGKLLKYNPETGWTVSELNSIRGVDIKGIAANAKGEIFAISQDARRLYKYDRESKRLKTVVRGLPCPTGIAIRKNGDILVATLHCELHCYTISDEVMSLVGRDLGHDPRIAVMADDSVRITNTDREVREFDAQARNTKLVGKMNTNADGGPQAIMSYGNDLLALGYGPGDNVGKYDFATQTLSPVEPDLNTQVVARAAAVGFLPGVHDSQRKLRTHAIHDALDHLVVTDVTQLITTYDAPKPQIVVAFHDELVLVEP